ncbi:tripartite tricarboxylate transporter substrate binding protein [uncultured Xylophilus sp.]|uniref:Bug family tripartite tricarboxylate transporter substrate binding protein n=1 Tax=uncultured Xylophilus sp. TaxID=296832 RepID=UPI0025DA5182|nr:tripartite tricarboxylate transporter substrate binding protein [uncultured Xylophilus sp.]
MRRTFFRNAALFALAAGSLAYGPATHAQAFPTKPVRIIVPATPGGTSDIFARALATRMQDSLGQPVLVEYKPGAGTNIGTDFVAKAPPDGYTLLINGLTLAVNPALYPSLSYSPSKDLVPVIEVAEMTNVVTVHPSVPAKNMKELVALMKSKPNTFNFGTPGAGSSGHLSGELLALKTGTQLTHVAYQGNAQATTDHIGGVLQVGFVNMPVAQQFIKNGRLRALAVTGAKRSPLMPDLPTVAEALNLPDYALTGWFGIMAPAGTPAPVIEKLQAEFDKALQDPVVRNVITQAGGDVVGGSTAAFGTLLKNDTARLTEVIRAAGITNK